MLADDEDTEEEEGSDEDKGREREPRTPAPDDEGEGGEGTDLGALSEGGCAAVGVDPWGRDDGLGGLDGGSVGLV